MIPFAVQMKSRRVNLPEPVHIGECIVKNVVQMHRYGNTQTTESGFGVMVIEAHFVNNGIASWRGLGYSTQAIEWWLRSIDATAATIIFGKLAMPAYQFTAIDASGKQQKLRETQHVRFANNYAIKHG